MGEPISFTAAKAAKTNNAADWTPRDVLVDVLAKLDAGAISPVGLIVTFYEEAEGGLSQVKFSTSMPNIIMAAGTLERTLHALSPPAEQM